LDVEAIIVRDIQGGRKIDSYPCAGVANESDLAEEVICLRMGDGPICEDMLVVSDSQKQQRFLFTGYPVIRDGITHTATVVKVEPWEHGIEGWVHLSVTGEGRSLAFFDTRYYAGTAALQPGQRVDVVLAGLAYSLEPLVQASIEIDKGALWEMEKQRRLEEGMSAEEAERPVMVLISGMTAFIPRDGEYCDDAEFAGVIEAIDTFVHAAQTFYRLDLVLLRNDDEAFHLPIFVSEQVLDGYVPRLGEDIRGVMWVQGHLSGRYDASTSDHDNSLN